MSKIQTAPDCTCKHFLNTMTSLLLFLDEVSLRGAFHYREFTVKAEQKKVAKEGKPSNFNAVNKRWLFASSSQETVHSALFLWHTFPAGVKRGLTLVGESPGDSSLWAVMTTRELWWWALDASTHCIVVGFVTNPLPTADYCLLPMLLPAQRPWEVISTGMLICIADLRHFSD